ncbi:MULTISPECIES: isocitrate lyase/phosphoenolpyruvate mutase family protein [unclassified Streptomyces]|uniref:isocitrate lyase/PEP mutase family protein n=1 Tax=unclassified Streptomyces TaxID=2593676 RepID=UPI00073BE7AB|nr:isocitrate lyase/phosphoenolpyruvate mutase family protein [Streptomyces sp. AVP053U2]ODA74945.1 Carboxyvinyl-carboxyphosphonate phosphorylmutase [Streptomyces sp. AVP053U2]
MAATRAGEFLALHDRTDPGDPLVIPNVWDAVSARAFAEAGFPALATSSAAVAAVLGHDDGEDTPADEMFAAIKRIVHSVDVPVTADIEGGYGLAPGEIVERLLDAGAIGCNLEDSAGRQLKDAEQQAEWLSEVSVAAGERLVLNARIDTFLYGDRSVESAVKRACLYIGAGADVVYPILAPEELLPGLANDVSKPLNALHRPGNASPSRLGCLGAARVTFGDGLHQQAVTDVTDLARRTGRAYGAQ